MPADTPQTGANVMRSEKTPEVAVQIDSRGHQEKSRPDKDPRTELLVAHVKDVAVEKVHEKSVEMKTKTKTKTKEKVHEKSAKTIAKEKVRVKSAKMMTNASMKSNLSHKSGTSGDPAYDAVHSDNILGEEDAVEQPAPMSCTEHADLKLTICTVQRDRECDTPDKELKDGTETLQECAQKVMEAGGRFLSFGQLSGPKEKQCYQEFKQSSVTTKDCYKEQDAAHCCPKGYEVDYFDYYLIIPDAEKAHVMEVESQAFLGARVSLIASAMVAAISAF